MKKKIIDINYICFPVILTAALAVSFLESYKYLGFLQKNLHIPASLFYLLSLISTTAIIASKSKLSLVKKNLLLQRFLKMSMLVFFLCFFIYILLSGCDVVFFKNFSFSTFHIQPGNLAYSVIILFEAALLFFISNNDIAKLRNKILTSVKYSFYTFFKELINQADFDFMRTLKLKENLFRINILLIASVVILSLFGFYNLFVCIKGFVKYDTYIVSHPNLTYRDKMEQEWGILFYLVEAIQDNTPDNSRILFPPFITPWSVAGNINQVKYFLGNRVLINAESASSINGDPDYIVIARGGLHAIYDVVKSEDEYGWPKVFVPADAIWYLKPGSWNAIEFHQDFDPKDPQNMNAWGLIKVDKSRL